MHTCSMFCKSPHHASNCHTQLFCSAVIHQGRDQGVSQPILIGDRGLLKSIKVWRSSDLEVLLEVERLADGRWPIPLNLLGWGYNTDAVAYYGLLKEPLQNMEGLLPPVPAKPKEPIPALLDSPVKDSVDSQTSGEPSQVLVTPEKKKVFSKMGSDALTPSGKGRKVGQKDYTYNERLRIIDWARNEGHIIKEQDEYWVRGHPGEDRAVAIPWDSKERSIAVDTVLDWARLAEKQCWREMLDDEALKKKFGDNWGETKSRLPNIWRITLDGRKGFSEDSLPKLGQPAYLEKHPALMETLCKVDNMHKEERMLLEPATAEGFHQTLNTELQMQQTLMPGKVPKSVSKTWTQQRLKDLKAQEVKKPCADPATVTPQDEADYKTGLKNKLDQIGDLRLQLAWDEFNCVVDQAANKTLLHRTEPTAPWHEQRGHNLSVSSDMESRPHDHETDLGIVFYYTYVHPVVKVVALL